MQETKQDALGRYIDLATGPDFKLARVTAIHIDTNTVDLSFFDGMQATQIPVLTGLQGTTFGLVTTADPTSTGTAFGATATFDGTGLNAANTDIYAVVGSFQGPRVSKSYFVIGFISPQMTVMKFDTTQLNGKKLAIYRHPSDVQVTIDDNACVEIQHPSGTRVAIGDTSEITSQNILTNKVDLTGKDLNKLYDLSKSPNASKKAGFVVMDVSGNSATFDGNGTITIKDAAGDTITMTNDSIDIKDNAGDDVNISNGTITIKDVAGDEVTMATGVLTVQANVAVNIVSTTVVDVTAPIVNLGSVAAVNGVARLGDTVLCPAGTGVIVTASEIVHAD